MNCGQKVHAAIRAARLLAPEPTGPSLEVGASAKRLLSPHSDTIFVNQDRQAIDSLDRGLIGDAGHLPFSDQAFDRVYACFLFCSLSDPGNVAAEIRRVLRKGGLFISVEHELGGTPFSRNYQRVTNLIYMKPRGKCSLTVAAGSLIAGAGLRLDAEVTFNDSLQPLFARAFSRSITPF